MTTGFRPLFHVFCLRFYLLRPRHKLNRRDISRRRLLDPRRARGVEHSDVTRRSKYVSFASLTVTTSSSMSIFAMADAHRTPPSTLGHHLWKLNGRKAPLELLAEQANVASAGKSILRVARAASFIFDNTVKQAMIAAAANNRCASHLRISLLRILTTMWISQKTSCPRFPPRRRIPRGRSLPLRNFSPLSYRWLKRVPGAAGDSTYVSRQDAGHPAS